MLSISFWGYPVQATDSKPIKTIPLKPFLKDGLKNIIRVRKEDKLIFIKDKKQIKSVKFQAFLILRFRKRK